MLMSSAKPIPCLGSVQCHCLLLGVPVELLKLVQLCAGPGSLRGLTFPLPGSSHWRVGVENKSVRVRHCVL